jgi:hypothetical protein
MVLANRYEGNPWVKSILLSLYTFVLFALPSIGVIGGIVGLCGIRKYGTNKLLARSLLGILFWSFWFLTTQAIDLTPKKRTA